MLKTLEDVTDTRNLFPVTVNTGNTVIHIRLPNWRAYFASLQSSIWLNFDTQNHEALQYTVDLREGVGITSHAWNIDCSYSLCELMEGQR